MRRRLRFACADKTRHATNMVMDLERAMGAVGGGGVLGKKTLASGREDTGGTERAIERGARGQGDALRKKKLRTYRLFPPIRVSAITIQIYCIAPSQLQWPPIIKIY